MPRVFLEQQVLDRIAGLSLENGAMAFNSTKDANGEIYLSEDIHDMIAQVAEKYEVSMSDAVTMMLDARLPSDG